MERKKMKEENGLNVKYWMCVNVSNIHSPNTEISKEWASLASMKKEYIKPTNKNIQNRKKLIFKALDIKWGKNYKGKYKNTGSRKKKCTMGYKQMLYLVNKFISLIDNVFIDKPTIKQKWDKTLLRLQLLKKKKDSFPSLRMPAVSAALWNLYLSWLAFGYMPPDENSLCAI